jgi:CubicO group peptidase (beta-lactamase class C family)
MARPVPAPAPAPAPRRRRSAAGVLRALCVLAAAAGAAPLAAQTAPAAAGPAAPARAALPDTPLGRLGRQLVDVVNAGDSAAVARFVAAHLAETAMPGASAAAHVRTLVTLGAQSGGLAVERAHMAGPALRLFARARGVPRLLGLELEPAPGDTARLAHLGLYPMDPAMMGGPPAPWADGPLADTALARVVRARVRQAADSDRFAGVVLVAHGDRVLVHEAVGFADAARRRPNTTTTLFQTTSVGKMFAGVAVAQLVGAGRLAFDDTLARLLPDYPNPDAARRTTVRQLLTHTAGVPEPFFSPAFGAAPDGASHGALLATFAGAPPAAAPGARFAYSNGNYAALAAVVERASGLPYEAYLRRHVWGPAGMRHVAHPAWSDAPGLAVAHARFADRDPLGLGPRTAAAAPARPARPALRGFGGGAYTAHDLFRFARALRTGRLLGPALTDSVVAGRVDAGGGPPGAVQYGFGVYARRLPGGARVVGHPGSNPNTGWDADLELVWDGDWTVIVLSNYDAPAGIALAGPIVDLVARQGAPAAAPPAAAAGAGGGR